MADRQTLPVPAISTLRHIVVLSGRSHGPIQSTKASLLLVDTMAWSRSGNATKPTTERLPFTSMNFPHLLIALPGLLGSTDSFWQLALLKVELSFSRKIRTTHGRRPKISSLTRLELMESAGVPLLNLPSSPTRAPTRQQQLVKMENSSLLPRESSLEEMTTRFNSGSFAARIPLLRLRSEVTAIGSVTSPGVLILA